MFYPPENCIVVVLVGQPAGTRLLRFRSSPQRHQTARRSSRARISNFKFCRLFLFFKQSLICSYYFVKKDKMETPYRYDLSAIKKSLELAETLASVSLMTPASARRRLQARSVELGLRPGQAYEPPRELLLYLVR